MSCLITLSFVLDLGHPLHGIVESVTKGPKKKAAVSNPSKVSASSTRAPKRKAAVMDVPDNEETLRSTILQSGCLQEARLLTTAQNLSREYSRLIESRVADFLKHHESISAEDPIRMYLDENPQTAGNELDIMVARFEREIHYCLDLYHVSWETRGLSTGQEPASRDVTWYDRVAQERFKRRAL